MLELNVDVELVPDAKELELNANEELRLADEELELKVDEEVTPEDKELELNVDEKLSPTDEEELVIVYKVLRLADNDEELKLDVDNEGLTLGGSEELRLDDRELDVVVVVGMIGIDVLELRIADDEEEGIALEDGDVVVVVVVVVGMPGMIALLLEITEELRLDDPELEVVVVVVVVGMPGMIALLLETTEDEGLVVVVVVVVVGGCTPTDELLESDELTLSDTELDPGLELAVDTKLKLADREMLLDVVVVVVVVT